MSDDASTPHLTRDRAAYQKERRRAAVLLYFRSETELAEFKAMAKASGYSHFNQYLLQMLHNATSGSLYPPEFVEGLKQDAERLRRWLETARDESDSYCAQVRTLLQQRDVLLVLIHGLPTGAEVAARFLQQSAQEARS
jgi:hypothetical protein